MKKIVGLFPYMLFILGFGQKEKKKLYVKGDVLTALVLMPNVGLEYQLATKYTLQGDVFISP